MKKHDFNVLKTMRFQQFYHLHFQQWPFFFSKSNNKNQLIFRKLLSQSSTTNKNSNRNKFFLLQAIEMDCVLCETSIVMCHDSERDFQYNDSSHPCWIQVEHTHTHKYMCANTSTGKCVIGDKHTYVAQCTVHALHAV